MDCERLRAAFAARYGRPCAVVARAPGRVNLIGEHTDYNDGFVLPIAIGQSTWVAAGPAPADAPDRIRAYSANLQDEQFWPAGRWSAAGRPHWTSYVAGVAELLAARSGPAGADLLIESEVPLGSGLSSSAALSVAVALALGHLAGRVPDVPVLAALCRLAEHRYAGVPCGVMDPYASLAARAAAALLLDCRTLTYEHVPLRLDDDVFVVIDSGVKHELASSEYARRQQQCAAAVAFFQRLDPAVRALRDVTPAMVQAHAGGLDPTVAARARHVTTEIVRTLAAAEALRQGDLDEMGRLMNASHASLRDDYQVSSPELDLLVELAQGLPRTRGARMTGGGFGGSIVALLARAEVPELEQVLRRGYDQPGRQSRLWPVRPGPGADIVYP